MTVRALVAIFAVVSGLVIAVLALNMRDEDSLTSDTPVSTPTIIERGAYLARAGHCMGCHTERGGVPYAGGRGIETPFGTVYTPNLTPDDTTGLGRWTSAEFWRALHNGRSRDGRWLSPAFPYANYSLVTRADSDALYAYLRNLPPSAKPMRPHELRFPFGSQAALAVWRALFFKPERFVADPGHTPQWNRGAYLVRGLGHCSACHGRRNVWGATSGTGELDGAMMPVGPWYAPSLHDPREAGVSTWPTVEVVALLKTGRGPHASVLGPMADVVVGSTQHLTEDDLGAMAQYLQSLGPRPALHRLERQRTEHDLTLGAKVYADHCVQCHGERGEGVAGIYPPLAGNRAVLLGTPANLVRVLMEGGFSPSTPGHPRPFGMPPYGGVLSAGEMAAVLTYVRQAWGNQATPVSGFEVSRLRGG